MAMWFDNKDRYNHTNNAALALTKGVDPSATGVKNIGKAIANYADLKVKQKEQEELKQQNLDEKEKKELEASIKKQDEKTAKKALIRAYRKRHPKFSHGLEDDELFEYIKAAGKSVTNPNNGKVIDVHTAPDGKRYASVRKPDGKIEKEFLGQVKDYTKNSSKKDFGYGFNKDGSAKTATQFGEEQTKKRKDKNKKREDEIASLKL